MRLKDKLREESVLALKGGDKRLVEVLRFVIAMIDKRELQLPEGKMDEVEEIAVLRKELKNRQEAREMFVQAKRDDLVEQQDYEIEVIKKYLPVELDESEIAKLVDEVMAEGASGFGAVMGQVMKKVAGRAGGGAVTAIVKQKIGGQ